MGTYLIPDATSTAEAAAYPPFVPGRRWTLTDEGVLFRAPTLTDEECAALYEGFTPSGVTDEEYEPPLPFGLDVHLPHLHAYFEDPQAASDAELRHIVADVIRALRFLNTRLE